MFLLQGQNVKKSDQTDEASNAVSQLHVQEEDFDSFAIFQCFLKLIYY